MGARDGLARLVDGLGVLVDEDALHGAQQARAQPSAVEGRRVQLGQAATPRRLS